MFTVGGIDIYIHKYLGPIVDPEQTNNPGDATLPTYDTTNPLFIEDLLLLENRDRAYDPDVYIMRGVYRTQDVDFDLTQFGLFLNNDTLFITFHYNNMIDTFGRKLMVGDVIEVPNLNSGCAKFFGRNWKLFYVPRHINHFTKESLRTICLKAGLIPEIGENEMPLMGNTLAIFFNLDQSNSFVKIAGILLHPIQMIIESCYRSSSCINAKCSIPDDLKRKS
jgi:hypothetical protein